MAGQESRRKSRRRSLRFLKPASEETVVSDVYGSVWLAESDKQVPQNHSQRDTLQYDCQNEGKELQQSGYQEKNQEIQSHCDNEIGKIKTPDNKISRTQDPCDDVSGKNQSLYQNDSGKLKFHSHSGNVKDPIIVDDSDSDNEKFRSYYLKKIRKQQFSFCKSDTSVQSFDLQSTHQSLDKSDEIQTPCQGESDEAQVVQPICQDESYRDQPVCHNELVSPQSLGHSDRLQVSCHSECVELQYSGNNNENKIVPQCHSESDHFWSVDHDTPEDTRSASAALHTPQLSLSLKEAAPVVETSYTPQTVYSDFKKKNALSTTPLCNESECEMGNEASLNNGLYNVEESPHVFENNMDACSVVEESPHVEKNMDACSVEAVRLQREDPEVSPDVNLLARIMVKTPCSEILKLKSVGNSASSFSNTQVSLTSEITNNTSCSDSICTTVALPSCSDSLQSHSDSTGTVYLPAFSPAGRYEQTTAVVYSDTPTSAVSSDQKQSIEGFCGAATISDRKWSSDNSTDKVVQAAQNTDIASDGSSETGTSQSVTLTDTSQWNANGTQSDRMDDFCQEQLHSCASKLSPSVTLVSFPSTEVHSQAHVVLDETPDSGDGDPLTSCMDKTDASSCAIISQQTETVSQKADSCWTIMADTTESLKDSSADGKLHSALEQHSQSFFQDSEQEEQKIKDSKNKRKNRRRSAYGAELKLDIFRQQNAAVSAPAKMQWIGTINESFMLPKDDQDADRLVDSHVSVEKACHETNQEEESTQPVRTRRKRKSTDTCLEETIPSTSSQDTPACLDSDSNSPTFTKRRSSLRLYRQQYRSVDSTASDDESISVKMQPLATVMDTDLSFHQQEDSDCEEEEADCDTIPFALEQLYRNKNYRKPADKSWETIFESPSKGRETSKQRLKRCIQFTDHVPVSKLKRRMKKAAQNGWDVDSKKFHKRKNDVLKKLEELDNEMSLEDN